MNQSLDQDSYQSRWKANPSLKWHRVHGRKSDWWVVSNRLHSQMVRLGDDERSLVELFTKPISIQELIQNNRERLSRIFRSETRLYSTIEVATHQGILVKVESESDALDQPIKSPFQTDPTRKQVGSEDRRPFLIYPKLRRWLASPWRLIQAKVSFGSPRSISDFIALPTSWLFRKAVVYVWLILAFLVFVLVLRKLLLVTSSLELATWFPGVSDLGQVAIILLLTRIVHELGHLSAAQRYGVDCDDFGVLMMFGMVYPYIDVSNSWKLPDYRARMIISAGGIYFEMIIATLAGLVWLMNVSDFIQAIAWQTMIVCSITTLLINANPLMRYDGYYLLSDWLDSPNLRERSDLIRNRWISKILFGETSIHRRGWNDFGLGLFSISASAYRMSLVLSIATAVAWMSSVWQVPALGSCFGLVIITSTLVGAVLPWGTLGVQIYQRKTYSQRFFGLIRFVLFLGALGYLVYWIGNIPIQDRISAYGMTRLEQSQQVYVPSSGRLRIVSPEIQGRSLEEGYPATQVLASTIEIDSWRLKDASLMNEIETAMLEERLRMAQRLSFYSPLGSENQIRFHQWLIASQEKQERFAELIGQSRIEIPDGLKRVAWFELPDVSPVQGEHLWVPDERGFTLADSRNANRLLPVGIPVAEVSATGRIVVECQVEAPNLNHIAPGSTARIILEQYPNQIFSGKISKISNHISKSDSLPRTAGRRADFVPDERQETARKSWAEVSISLECELDHQYTLPNGTAFVVIFGSDRTSFERLADQIGAIFR